ncbi:MAG: alkaline phosphatase family protein, partial [Chloroflexota bacterium]
ACAPIGNPFAAPSPTATLFLFPTRTPTLPVTATPVLPTGTVTPTPAPTPTAARVLIVSFDGMRPDAIEAAPMNTLLGLMRASQGAYSLKAQTILPSSTLPAHASMLGGLCPAKHGVTWNEYLPGYGYALGTDLFDLAHAAGLRTVMIVGKEKLRQVTEPTSTDVFIFADNGEADLTQQAIGWIAQGFGLMFVHFPNPDLVGHEYGWMSGHQLQALREGDAELGQLLAALDENGLRDSTLVIVTSDHGGLNTSHGGSALEETTIPWIVSGPFVHAGLLTGYVHTTDTAATAAYVLGLPRPVDWDGAPVLEAFGLPDRPHTDPCVY